MGTSGFLNLLHVLASPAVSLSAALGGGTCPLQALLPRSVGGATYFSFFLTSITKDSAKCWTSHQNTASAQETKIRDKPAEAITMPPFIYDDIVELESASELIKTLYSVVHIKPNN